MSMTTEQIKKLKDEADLVECTHDYTAKLLREAADTIKVQSAKIHAYAMERSTAYYNSGWIPVKERLPEENMAVLVWCPTYRNIYCAYRLKEQWWIFGAFSQIIPNEVIAWMPLPEPYREDGETDE